MWNAWDPHAPAEAGTLATAPMPDGWKQSWGAALLQQHKAAGQLSINFCMKNSTGGVCPRASLGFCLQRKTKADLRLAPVTVLNESEQNRLCSVALQTRLA